MCSDLHMSRGPADTREEAFEERFSILLEEKKTMMMMMLYDGGRQTLNYLMRYLFTIGAGAFSTSEKERTILKLK